MNNKDDIKLYYYNGFDKPEKIDIDSIVIMSNYLGDVTSDFQEEYKDILNNYTLEEMEENQPLYYYKIWINPTLEQLQEQNTLLYGIPKNTYLEDFNRL